MVSHPAGGSFENLLEASRSFQKLSKAATGLDGLVELLEELALEEHPLFFVPEGVGR